MPLSNRWEPSERKSPIQCGEQVLCSAQSQVIHLQPTPAPRARDHSRKEGGKSQETKDFRETTPMKSHQQPCLNKTWTKTVPTDTLNWKGKGHKASTLDKNYGPPRNANNRRNSPPPGKSSHSGYPIPDGQLWKYIHASNIIWTKQVVFMYLE